MYLSAKGATRTKESRMNVPSYYEAIAAQHRLLAAEATTHENACYHLEMAFKNSGLAVSASDMRNSK